MRVLIFLFFSLLVVKGFTQEIKKLEGYANGVHHVSFSSDGNWLLTGSGISTNRAEIRDARTGDVVISLPGIESSVAKGGWFPSGDFLYTSSGTGSKVQIWAVNGELIKSIEEKDCKYTSEIAFNPKKEGFVMSCDSKLYYFNNDFQKEKELEVPEILETFYFNKEGVLFVGSAYEALHIYNDKEANWQSIQLPLGPRNIEETPSGEIMLTDYYVMSSDKPSIRFFEDGEATKSFTFEEKVLSAKWVPNKAMILATFSGGSVRLIDAEGKVIKELGRFGSFPLSLAVNPDGQNAAIGYLGALVLIDLSKF